MPAPRAEAWPFSRPARSRPHHRRWARRQCGARLAGRQPERALGGHRGRRYLAHLAGPHRDAGQPQRPAGQSDPLVRRGSRRVNLDRHQRRWPAVLREQKFSTYGPARPGELERARGAGGSKRAIWVGTDGGGLARLETARRRCFRLATDCPTTMCVPCSRPGMAACGSAPTAADWPIASRAAPTRGSRSCPRATAWCRTWSGAGRAQGRQPVDRHQRGRLYRLAPAASGGSAAVRSGSVAQCGRRRESALRRPRRHRLGRHDQRRLPGARRSGQHARDRRGELTAQGFSFLEDPRRLDVDRYRPRPAAAARRTPGALRPPAGSARQRGVPHPRRRARQLLADLESRHHAGEPRQPAARRAGQGGEGGSGRVRQRRRSAQPPVQRRLAARGLAHARRPHAHPDQPRPVGDRSQSSDVQRQGAAGAGREPARRRRAAHAGSPAGGRLAARCRRREARDPLHRAELPGARSRAVSLQARRLRSRLGGRRHAAGRLLHAYRTGRFPLSRPGLQQRRRLERRRRRAGLRDGAAVRAAALVPGAAGGRTRLDGFRGLPGARACGGAPGDQARTSRRRAHPPVAGSQPAPGGSLVPRRPHGHTQPAAFDGFLARNGARGARAESIVVL